jgi:hypothetical protein
LHFFQLLRFQESGDVNQEGGWVGVLMERGLELVCVESDTRQAVM